MESRRTTTPQLNKEFVNVWLDAIKARPAGALINVLSGKIRLCTAMPSPLTPILSPGDFTEPTNADLAEQDYDPTAVAANVLNPSGDGMSNYAHFVWVCVSDPAPAETVIGYYVYDGTRVVLAERFADPVAFNVAGDGLEIESFIPLVWTPDV